MLYCEKHLNFFSNMALFRRSKNTNKLLLGQILELIPSHLLRNEIYKHQCGISSIFFRH